MIVISAILIGPYSYFVVAHGAVISNATLIFKTNHSSLCKGSWYITLSLHGHRIDPTCFKTHLPVLAVEVAVHNPPEDVRTMGQGEGMQELGHCQGGQLAEL